MVEDWPFVDDRDLISFRGMQSCATCHHFGYVALSQCQVLGGCHLKQGLLAPGAHALKRCALELRNAPKAAERKHTQADASHSQCTTVDVFHGPRTQRETSTTKSPSSKHD